MFKRAVLATGLAAAALAPVPALARDAASPANGLSEMSAKLADPEFQGALAGMMQAMAGAMLDMKMAPLAKAAEAMGDRKMSRRIGPETTLRDMAGRDGARMERELGEKLPQAMTAMSGMAGAMEAMLPQLEAMARKMGDQMGRIEGQAGETPES